MKKFILSVMMMAAVVAAKAQYKVGDIYNEDGVKGLVALVSEDGAHGVLLSLDGESTRWTDGDLKNETSAFDADDGMKNMEAIEAYINESGKSWKDFPLFNWARELGDGWYIPSVNEALAIVISLNGGTEVYDAPTIKELDKKIKKAKGKTLRNTGMGQDDNFLPMMTSTEAEGGLVTTVRVNESVGSAARGVALGRFSSQQGTLSALPMLKNMGMGTRSRAIYKF